MATYRFSILQNVFPDSSGRCFAEPYNIKATNDLFRHLVFIFNDPADGEAHGFYGVFNVPTNYVSTPKIIPVWTSTATSGNCKFDFDYRAIGGDDAESLDQATFQENLTLTDAAPTSAHQRNTPSMSITDANLAPNDTAVFYFTREDGGGTDTLAATAILHDLIFEFADT